MQVKVDRHLAPLFEPFKHFATASEDFKHKAMIEFWHVAVHHIGVSEERILHWKQFATWRQRVSVGMTMKFSCESTKSLHDGGASVFVCQWP